MASDGAAGDQGNRLYRYYEKECIKKGWKKCTFDMGKVRRSVLWKAPRGAWKHGAVITLHGGGGSCTNFGVNIPVGSAMEEFGEMAVSSGFAVFSPDSTDGLVTDSKGRPCGKRWDCIEQAGRENLDLPFLDRLISEKIPGLRPPGSSKAVFMTGISNGGFMTILAATHFPGKLTAFAPVSAGDPYGTYMDMGARPRYERTNAPGVFRDNETGVDISEENAALSDTYPHEKKWPSAPVKNLPPFRQFHHEGDGACDMSCMKKAQKQLIAHGHKDSGPFILKNSGSRSFLKHFWQSEYNKPLIDFFIKCAP